MGKSNGKDRHEDEQMELWQEPPVIAGLGITKFTLKGADITAELAGTTNVNDVAKLNRRAWAAGLAQWLVELCDAAEQAGEFSFSATSLVIEAKEILAARRATQDDSGPAFDNSEAGERVGAETH